MSAYYPGPNPPDAAELRVLGALIEKRRTTPDAYPLSVNSLRLACNQATNRDPVVEYDERTVLDALERLGRRGWTRLASGAGSRARKYRHLFDEALGLAADELSMLAVLMLRGPQTPGELKQRTDRLHPFADLASVEDTLLRLIDRELVARLPRRPGQKEQRYAQLLDGGDDDAPGWTAAVATQPTSAPAPAAHDTASEPAAFDRASAPESAAPVALSSELEERVDSLERQVAELSAELRALRAELGP
ncbi:MAG TPA: YceH family protein [Thermoleophilaceae bacterium]|nr:YceH family protein [Thermoleophilaceae bacterium]